MVAEPIPPAPAAQLVLASGSPRRRMLLATAGFDFEVDAPSLDESVRPGESAAEMVLRLATEKVLAVAGRYDGVAGILGCDTTVVLGSAILGKPASEADAVAMLLGIAGRTHSVVTGFALRPPHASEVEAGTAVSHVTMRHISKAEAAAYAASGEPLDKAGAYALQGDGSRFVVRVDGSRSNVIGLPLEAIVPLLRRHGFTNRRT